MRQPFGGKHGARHGNRQPSVKYLNQDHRSVQRVTRPLRGLQSFEAAQDTQHPAGSALIHMLKKGQRVSEDGEEAFTPAEQCYAWVA